MAIQVRRGNESDFNASKMLPGEWAVSLDTKYVRMCFAPGVVLRMATYEGFEADKAQIQAILAECRSIQSAVQRIQAEVNSKASLVVEYSNNAKTSADKAHSEAERAKIYADNAEAVTGVQIATKERAGLIKGGDNHIAEDGTLILITATTSTTLPNSYAGRFKFDEIGGVTEQDSTAGNQLAQQVTVGSELAIYNSALIIKADFKPNTQYTFSFKGAVGNRYYINENMFVDDISFTIVDGINTFTATTKDADFSSQWVGNSGYLILKNHKSQTSQNKFEEVMVNLGTTALPYEPYTGGQPAPNPSYPQEIKKSVISGVKTHWKNFFGFGKSAIDVTAELRPNTVQRLNLSIVDGNPNKIKCNFTGGGYSTGYIAIYGVDGTKDWAISYDIESNTTEYTPIMLKDKTNSSKERLVILIDGGNIGTNVDASQYFVLSNIQVEEGTATPYEPYTESSITLSSPIELYGIGDVQDTIEDGKVVRRCAVKRNPTFNLASGYTVGNSELFAYSVSDGANKSVIMSNVFPYKSSNEILNNDVTGVYQLYNYIYARIQGVSDADEFNSLIADSVFVYELATPTTEALPIADQIALNSLQTYDGITYVEFDSEIQPTFKAEYGTSKVGGYTLESLLTARNNELKQNMVNERLSALETSVVNNI